MKSCLQEVIVGVMVVVDFRLEGEAFVEVGFVLEVDAVVVVEILVGG